LLSDTNKALTQLEIQTILGIRHLPAVNGALHSLLNRGFLECRQVEGKLYWRALNGKKISELLSTDHPDSTKESPDHQDDVGSQSVEGMSHQREGREEIHRQSSRVRHDNEGSNKRGPQEKRKAARKVPHKKNKGGD